MASKHSFARPKELSEFVRHAEDVELVPAHIKLQLFHALMDEILLAESRNPESKFMRDENGPRYDWPSENEYLDLTAVGKAWREAMLSVPTNLVGHVTFDQTLPQTLHIDGKEVSLHWETTLTGVGVAVLTMDVSSLVIGMVTVLRMRRGGGVTFDAVYDDGERPGDRHVQRLDEILRKLSK
ncbi:hypothetical protein LTR27_009332 [Elasticomyces elasticus]|nr:hypothetical protein LTR27_009332 [Elasticomyces elasticus]